MRLEMFLAVFTSVFLAELGDKTQLATLCFAADNQKNWLGVFLASSAALVTSSLLAVLVGCQLPRILSPQYIKIAAGLVFVVIGFWVLWDGFRA